MIVSLLSFIIIYLILCNWFQAWTFFNALRKPKSKIYCIEDPWISEILHKKVGLTLNRIIIFENSTLFGMMPGIPWKIEMILSRGLYETLNKDELEWVILHEAAHCKYWHVVKSGIVQIVFLFIGLTLMSVFSLSLLSTIFSSILLALLAIQCMKYFEWQADTFSITHVDNPQGVISAQDKFRMHRPKGLNWLYDENSILRHLLFWNITSSQRIQMARQREKEMNY